MKERDELELVLKLIGKYGLPLSPILEYAIKEKIEEFGGGEADSQMSASEEDGVELVPPIQVEEKVDAKPTVADGSGDVRIVEFGVRTIAVVGDTQACKAELKALGGYFVMQSQWGPAWVFRSKKREKLKAFIDGRFSKTTPPIIDSQEEEQRTTPPRYIIRVKYPNGSVFCSNLVWETLVDVVNYAGSERVRQLNIIHLGDNLVTARLNDNMLYRRAQKRVDRGLYVSTFSSTDAKYKQIERINEELNLGLRLEKVYVDDREATRENDNAQTYPEGEPEDRKRDRTKYSFEGGAWYSKRRFVLEVVKYYVATHPGVSYDTLLRVFPPSLNFNKANGVIKLYKDVLRQMVIIPDVRNRFFLKGDEIIEVANGIKVVVHNQWGDDFDKFLVVAKSLYRVKASNDEDGNYDIPSGKARIGRTSTTEQTQEDQRIGYVVRLFPSQQVGVIVSANTDGKGIKKLVVKTNEGSTVVIDDLPYFYEVMERSATLQEEANDERQEGKEGAETEGATIVLTVEMVEEARTPNGGFTKSQLAAIGVGWPPPQDWIQEKVGTMITPSQLADFNRIEYVAKSSETSYGLTGSKSYKDVAFSSDDRRKMEAILQAMAHFYAPATPRDIARTISRSAWGSDVIREGTVDSILKRLPEVEYVKWGKYILKSRKKDA